MFNLYASDAIERYARFRSEREAKLHYMPNIVSDLLREFDLNRSAYNRDDGTSDSYHQSNELHELAKSTEISDLNKMEEILKLKKEFFIKKANAFTNVLMMDAPDRISNTPLHIAILNQNLPVIKLLLAYGAGLFFKNKDGYTPLHCAVKYGCKDATEVLIQETLIQNSSAQKPDYLTGAFSTYWNRCLDEVKGMKEKKIDGSTTFYDILVSKDDSNELASYLRRENIAKILETGNYEEEFPLYANKIESKYDKGKERVKLLDKAAKAMETEHPALEAMPKLPLAVGDEIASFLSNVDLENLCQSANKGSDTQFG